MAAEGSDIEVFAAAEGMSLELEGAGTAPTVEGASALDRRSIVGQRVLFVSPDTSDSILMERTLVDDGLILMTADSSDTAIRRATEFTPSLVIVDEKGVPDHRDLAAELRRLTGRDQLPVILLTEGIRDSDPDFMSDPATDYLERPFSHPMLRSRVRAWVARTVIGQPETPAAPRPVRAEDALDVDVARNTHDDASALAQTTLFRDLDESQVAELIASASDQVFPAGYPILREGERGTSVFIIMSGKVRIMEAIAEGPADMFLGELGSGEIFGEIGFLRDSPRSATVATLERTRCLVLSQSEFRDVLESSAALCLALLRVIAGRLADADRLLARYAPDPLTGLPGRRAFQDLYDRLAGGARRRGQGLILLLIDIANLRTINDELGYAVGDDVLRATAEALVESSRATDLIARMGADDFAVLLIDTDTQHCDNIRRRVADNLADLAREHGLHGVIRFDVGVAVSETVPDNMDALLREADEEMQKAKFQNTAGI
jgi:diguanylate cyclase (GGDEF)-like protein